MVWSCFPFIRSGQNHLARHSGRRKKRRTEEEVGRQHQGLDRPGVCQVPEGSGEQGKMEETGCEIICGVPTTVAVKGQMMMIMCWSVSSFVRWGVSLTRPVLESVSSFDVWGVSLTRPEMESVRLEDGSSLLHTPCWNLSRQFSWCAACLIRPVLKSV